MRILLDTNIIVSGLITSRNPPGQLLAAWVNKLFTLLTSEAQLTEMRRVVGYTHVQRFLKPEDVSVFFDNVYNRAVLLVNLPEIHLSPDPNDNHILAAAIAGNADLIVTGDKRDLLSLGHAQGIPIVTARDALERLSKRS